MKLVRNLILHEEREEDDFIICNLFEDIEKNPNEERYWKTIIYESVHNI